MGKYTYLAWLGKKTISTYQIETFTLMDRKSLWVETVMDSTWPDAIVAQFVPKLGGGNQPADMV